MYLVLAQWSYYPIAQCDLFKCLEGHFTFMKLNKVLNQKSGLEIWYVVDIFKKNNAFAFMLFINYLYIDKSGFSAFIYNSV